MSTIRSPLPDKARDVTAEALQSALIELLDLSLIGKQAHWNVVGRNFRSLHLQLDELVATAREHADLVAERAAAIGVNPDGQAATVSSGSNLPQIGSGWIQDTDVVATFVDVLEKVVDHMRERVQVTAEADPVTQDLLIQTTAALEKSAWMFQAER